MKKKGIIICSIIGVVLLAVGVTLLLLAPKKTNKELYTEAIQKSLGLDKLVDGEIADKDLEKAISELKEKLEKNIYKITINEQVTQDEAGSSRSEDVLYVGKNQAYLKSTSILNDKTIDLEGMFKDNKVYFGLKDVLDKVYYIDKVDELLKESIKGGDNQLVDKIINYLGESFLDSINNDDVKVEKADLTINSKTYSAKQYSYTFSGNTLYEIVVNFVDKVKKDDSIVTEFNKLIKENGEMFNIPSNMELTKDQLNQMLDQIPEAAKALKDLGNLATYSVYMDGDDILSRQLTINIKSEQSIVPMKIADYKVDKYYKVSISAMGMDLYAVEVKEQSATNSTISVSMMKEEILTGYYSNNNGNFELKLETVGDLSSGSSMLLKINNDGTGSLNIVTDFSKLTCDYKIEEVDDIPEMDVENSVSFEEMTDEEKEKLQEFFSSFVPVQEDNIVSWQSGDYFENGSLDM